MFIFIITAGVLGLFFAFTVVKQVGRILSYSDILPKNRLTVLSGFSGDYFWNRWDVIPTWTLFAHPPAFDLRLFIRERSIDGESSPWRLVHGVQPSPFRFIWNPERRRHKAEFEMLLSLVKLIIKTIGNGDEDLRGVFESPLYKMIASYTSSLAAGPFASERQFLVLQEFPPHKGRRSEVLFISPLAPLPARVCGSSRGQLQ